jgi:peptide-methionine (S)-S-oxide reductase
MSESTERAILAGGCFWGMQDLLRRYDGVVSIEHEDPSLTPEECISRSVATLKTALAG